MFYESNKEAKLKFSKFNEDVDDNKFANLDVRHIMDTFFKALKQDPNKRVIAVETIYFSYWWDEQPEQDKQAIRELIEEGKLSFIKLHYAKYLAFNFIQSLNGEDKIKAILSGKTRKITRDLSTSRYPTNSLFFRFRSFGIYIGRMDRE